MDQSFNSLNNYSEQQLIDQTIEYIYNVFFQMAIDSHIERNLTEKIQNSDIKSSLPLSNNAKVYEFNSDILHELGSSNAELYSAAVIFENETGNRKAFLLNDVTLRLVIVFPDIIKYFEHLITSIEINQNPNKEFIRKLVRQNDELLKIDEGDLISDNNYLQFQEILKSLFLVHLTIKLENSP